MIYDAWLARHHAPRSGAADHALLELLAHHASRRHDARVFDLPYKAIGRMIGRSWSAVQRMVHRLVEGHWLGLDPRPGYANVYRVLFDWVKPQVDGERRAAERRGRPNATDAAAAAPAPADEFIAAPPAPPWIFAAAEVLDHHPSQ